MAVHFVGFRGDEYTRAVRVFGKPDFVHYHFDARCWYEIVPGDKVVIANARDDERAENAKWLGPQCLPPSYDDSARF